MFGIVVGIGTVVVIVFCILFGIVVVFNLLFGIVVVVVGIGTVVVVSVVIESKYLEVFCLEVLLELEPSLS